MSNAELNAARLDLVETVEMTDTGAFPGSKAWQRYSNACKALAAFDVAHPEILAAAQASHAAAMASYYQD